jgi:beta-glucuronidase
VSRTVQDLDGLWLFQVDRDEQGIERGWHTPAYAPQGWRTEAVPGNWDTYLPELMGYAGLAWYRRTFRPKPSMKNAHLHLRFEGANYATTVWLNGQEAGRHEGGFDPFEFEVTGMVRFDGDNTLAVLVDNWPRIGRVPNSYAGWWNYGGIYRGVKLLALPALRIGDVFVHAEPGEAGKPAPLSVEVTVANAGDAAAEVSLSALVLDAGRQVPVQTGTLAEKVSLALRGQSRLSLRAAIPQAKLWSPDSPHLYQLSLSIKHDTSIVDTREQSFGVRSFRVQGTRLLLNGEPITITGFDRHEEYAGSGRVDKGNTLEADLRLIKQMNGNMVRMHYQGHPDLYELADRIGLLVYAEIPTWGVGNKDAKELTDPEVRRVAEHMLRRLIHDLKNHPSVVIWSVGNECATNLVEARALIGHLVEVVRLLDPTRPVAYVGMFDADEKCFDLVDIPAINKYFGRRFQALGERLDAIHALTPDKPLLVTEFGHEAVSGLHGEGYGTEEEQAAVLEGSWQAISTRRQYIPGGLIWCLADYWHQPAGVEHKWMSRVYFCHGVTTLSREPKQAVSAVKDMWAKK